MRSGVILIAGVCLLGTPAFAASYSEVLSFSGNPSSGGNTVSGSVFNPALGTLTGVTMMATGSYTPHIYVGGPVSNPAAVLDVDLTTYGSGGGLTTIADGGEILTYAGGFLNGSAENFSEAVTVTNASALSQVYTAFGPYQSGGLIGLDVFSKAAVPGAWATTDDL